MRYSITIIAFLFSSISFAQKDKPADKIPVLIRCDDIGMCHAVNVAAKEVLETGMPVSMSVMVPCPWFAEAAELLKKYSNVSIGIHLTLNSEWKQYRWGPVSGSQTVPTLVDSLGLFFPSRSALFGNNPKLTEIETELRSQIEKALHAGLRIDYLDYHMGAAVQTLETRMIVEKLATEYKLGISRYYDEVGIEGWYFATPADKADSMMLKLRTLQPGGTKLFVVHVGLDTPEMNAMEDANPFGPKDMSKHRHAEFNALISPEFQKILHDPKYRIINYRMLNQEKGLAAMKRPVLDNMTAKTSSDTLTYHFRDASTAPQYHRSYTIRVTPGKVYFAINVYSKIISEDSFVLTKAAYDSFAAAINDLHIKNREEIKGPGCSGGTSERLDLYPASSNEVKGYVDYCGGQTNGNLEGDIKTAAGLFKALIPDLYERIDATKKNN
jgi:predicted glycoside hydrolase/deacetylase ChbG (UPF0249 family)